MRAHHWLLAITWNGLFFIGIISYSLFQSGRPQVNPLLAMLVFISVYVPIVISAVMLVIAKRDERIYRVFVSLLPILLPGLSTFSVLFFYLISSYVGEFWSDVLSWSATFSMFTLVAFWPVGIVLGLFILLVDWLVRKKI